MPCRALPRPGRGAALPCSQHGAPHVPTAARHRRGATPAPGTRSSSTIEARLDGAAALLRGPSAGVLPPPGREVPGAEGQAGGGPEQPELLELPCQRLGLALGGLELPSTQTVL